VTNVSQNTSVFLKPLLEKSDATYQLVNRRNGRVVAQTVSTAFDSESRRKGLLGRDSLALGAALVIAPTNAIHTWFMRFPIDVAFITRDGRIVKVAHRLPAWRMSMALRGYAVVELPAGALASSETVVGDLLVLEPAADS
jgi:uncharacterized membrane protein (UPF0127 family)